MLNRFKKCSFVLAIVIGLVCPGVAAFAETPCKAEYGNGETVVRLATGSPGELGLVEVLAAAFNRENDTRICWKKAGSGKSLKLLEAREVDVVMVHAPAAEKAAVAEGWAIKRSLIGSNEFYIVGPPEDPAGIAAAKSAADAYARIATAGAPFLSRGDNSGTHKKEMFIWRTAGIEPSGSWYIVTKTFMLASLRQADQLGGYFMTDSSTWVAAKKEMTQTKLLFRGDPVLINTYHALCQPPGATAAQSPAADFVDFLSSEAGQSVLRAYGVKQHGEGLYNDAAYAKKYDH
jgi:tungstate transport system substrate-binding protein